MKNLLNTRLEEVREDCHFKIAELIKENENKEHQIYAYKNLAPELYSLAQYTIEEIIKNMPYVSDDIDTIWALLL